MSLEENLLFKNNFYCAISDPEPFCPQQILIVSKSHDAEPDQTSNFELGALQNEVLKFLIEKLSPDGFNIGTTISLEENHHKTVKIIPRFFGDVDFVKTIGQPVGSIYAPWRHNYVVKDKEKNLDFCVFCHNIEQTPSHENLVIGQTEQFALVLNKYPYSRGHLMIIPKRHIQSVLELSAEEFHENELLCGQAMQILSQSFGVQEFNIGYNLGAAGGAGIPKHLHRHIVPRYQGDNDYDPWLAKNNFIDLETDFYKLEESFQAISKTKNTLDAKK